MSKAEDRMAGAIDAKTRLDNGTTTEELQAILITSGLIQPTEEMPLKKARDIARKTYRDLAGVNFLVQMYKESLKDQSLSQTAAAFPYVLKKEPEESTVSIFDLNPLEGMTDEEKLALKKFTVTSMRRKVGLEDD